MHLRNFSVFEQRLRPRDDRKRLWCCSGKIGQSSTRSRPLVSSVPSLSILPRAGRKRCSKTLKLRTCTAQEHMKTPGKYRLFYFSIWCIIECYPNSHSNSYKIKDSPNFIHFVSCIWTNWSPESTSKDLKPGWETFVIFPGEHKSNLNTDDYKTTNIRKRSASAKHSTVETCAAATSIKRPQSLVQSSYKPLNSNIYQLSGHKTWSRELRPTDRGFTQRYKAETEATMNH